MTKIQFLFALDEKLHGLAKEEIEERLTFYSEMIEDRIEEGLSEEEAVAAVGDVDEIAASIMAEFSHVKSEHKTVTALKRRLSGIEIALLIIGFPLWFSLLIGAVVVGIVLYVSLWVVVVSFWAAFGSFVAASLGSLVLCFVHLFGAHAVTGIALLGTAFCLAGLSFFAFYGCLALTKQSVKLTKWLAKKIGGLFKRREAA